ncbi:MAG TPA: hypothetical protein PLH60_09560 [Proteiniphilum sp.]|nr:hypothetical protein [Proteiniphilum sp.]HPJ51112.1 hypothetical protein [Proteiniphilum sp.]HPR20781.1 hypothetical protein [Proteiniphilum sp.]
MKELVSHIEFLLHDHNCVIIPGFGGFVVNNLPARRDGIATFHPPVSELVFNRYLTHNDGLLAQSFMKSDSIPFEAAMQKIEHAVQEMLRELREGKKIELGALGQFEMNSDKQFVYKPTAYVQPLFFGLKTASLKPLVQMQPSTVKTHGEQKSPRMRTVGITAAAAAVLLLLMFLLPVGDRTIVHQSAQIISETDLFGSRPHLNKSNAATAEPVVTEESTDVTMEEATVAEPEIVVANEQMPRYYIIVGVYEVKEVAEKMMEKLMDGGFTERGWMKRPGRIDVYAASFADREEAEGTLRKIHLDYPAYREAWILKR